MARRRLEEALQAGTAIGKGKVVSDYFSKILISI